MGTSTVVVDINEHREEHWWSESFLYENTG